MILIELKKQEDYLQRGMESKKIWKKHLEVSPFFCLK